MRKLSRACTRLRGRTPQAERERHPAQARVGTGTYMYESLGGPIEGAALGRAKIEVGCMYLLLATGVMTCPHPPCLLMLGSTTSRQSAAKYLQVSAMKVRGTARSTSTGTCHLTITCSRCFRGSYASSSVGRMQEQRSIGRLRPATCAVLRPDTCTCRYS